MFLWLQGYAKLRMRGLTNVSELKNKHHEFIRFKIMC